MEESWFKDHEIYWVKGGCLFTAKFLGKGPH